MLYDKLIKEGLSERSPKQGDFQINAFKLAFEKTTFCWAGGGGGGGGGGG